MNPIYADLATANTRRGHPATHRSLAILRAKRT